jgi:ankyrin repeat protein
MALAVQCGHAHVVDALIDAGEDPNRFNPPGTHSHSPPLHQAIAAGHLNVVKLLIDRGARLDIKDTIYESTPLGWAEYCEQPEIGSYLKSIGAR